MPTASQIARKTITSGQWSPRAMTYQGAPTSAIKKVPVRKAILGTLSWSFVASVTFVLPRGWEVALLRTSRARRPPGPAAGPARGGTVLEARDQFLEGLPRTNASFLLS